MALLAASSAPAAETLIVPPQLRLLVVAPHPDDESLGAGGLIQQTLAAGGRVHVLFMTNGDGYPEAVEVATGRHEPSADDYRRFGELRRAEALVALERYRVLPMSVTFLGFPDDGLAEIWRRGARGAAYESPYTRQRTPSYAHAFEPGARYRSDDLIRLIARVVARSDPDWIALPTPLDHHPDHCATFAFVVAALRSPAARSGGDGKRRDRLLTYLVHTSMGWPPLPQTPGPLPEPAKLFAPARWYSLALTDDQVKTKLDALEAHRSEAAVMETLFRSFARSNELFGVIEGEQITALVPGTPACGPKLSSEAAAIVGTPPAVAVTPAVGRWPIPSHPANAPTLSSHSSANGHGP